MKKRIALTIITLGLITTTLNNYLNNPYFQKEEDNLDNKDKFEVSDTVEKNNSEDKDIIIYDSLYSDTLNEEDISILKSKVTFNNPDFEDIIKSINVSYPYEELYTKEYKMFDKLNTDTNYLDKDALYKKVLENNQAYQDRFNFDTFYSTTDSFVNKITDLIIDSYKQLENNGISFDENHLNKTLENLNVFSYTGYNYGYYNSEKGILGININLDNEISEEIITHEIMHVLSTSSTEELKENNLKNKVGFMYQDEDGISAYNWSWFSEGASEALSLELNNIETPYIYTSEIKAIEAMKLAIFDTNNSLEKVIFSNDISDLYNLFPNLSHEEVNKMFYAYTIILHSNSGQEGNKFYQELEKKGVIIEPGKYDSFDTNLKGSILLSLSKEFYINLARKINNNTSLEDIFKLISVYELEVSRISWYQSRNQDLEYFLRNYCEIQDAFFSSLNMDLDYIKNLYYMYNNEINLSNVEISFLNEKENSYLNYINESRTGNKKDAILKVYSDNFRNLQKIN